MGMFDEVAYDLPLPDGRKLRKSGFQTKDLGASMARFTLTSTGTLVHHHPNGDKTIPIHGDVELYGDDETGTFAECVARFTHGKLEYLKMKSDLSEEERDYLFQYRSYS